MINSYPKIFNLGHAAITDLFNHEVVIQEKYDGSQVSWGWDVTGELQVRSKSKLQYAEGHTPDAMFQGAVDYLLTLEPPTFTWLGLTFRGEWFTKPKHNTLAYENLPKNGIVLYDVEDGEQNFLPPATVEALAEELGVEPARTFTLNLGPGQRITLTDLEALLKEQSTLGGPLVEGVVIKGYGQYGKDGKTLMGKLVSEAFREKHTKSWKTRNPNRADVLEDMLAALNTEARFIKAVQHLRDNGELKGEHADIGPLMKEVKRDVIEEEQDWILEKLREYFMPRIVRGVGRGLPEWYKAALAVSQFDVQTGAFEADDFVEELPDEEEDQMFTDPGRPSDAT